MRTRSKGYCHYCHAEYTKAGMIRHITACKERKKELEKATDSKNCGHFTLSITGKYNNNYWLIIECRENATLKDVDQFLRNIWLECCGHMSAFYIKGQAYDSSINSSGLWGPPSKSMTQQLKNVLEKGMVIDYEYDFGSTTYLTISVSNYILRPQNKDKITLMARNKPHEFLCSTCGKNVARSVCSFCIYEGEGYLCKDCEDSHECGVEGLLPICNSPRFGVCAYEGSTKYEDSIL